MLCIGGGGLTGWWVGEACLYSFWNGDGNDMVVSGAELDDGLWVSCSVCKGSHDLDGVICTWMSWMCKHDIRILIWCSLRMRYDNFLLCLCSPVGIKKRSRRWSRYMYQQIKGWARSSAYILQYLSLTIVQCYLRTYLSGPSIRAKYCASSQCTRERSCKVGLSASSKAFAYCQTTMDINAKISSI